MKTDGAFRGELELESFDVSAEEILLLWRTLKTDGLSAEEAWNAVVISMALDLAFERTQTVKQVLQ
jgi:hypothetical protein